VLRLRNSAKRATRRRNREAVGSLALAGSGCLFVVTPFLTFVFPPGAVVTAILAILCLLSILAFAPGLILL
jgi:hypothetical protein